MTVNTGGPIRGWLARWLVRFEASQQIFRIAFLAVTAASTLTTALELIGQGWLAPYVLAVGVIGSPLFAYGYVESGVYNRKNRERMDVGTNFAGPSMRIDDELIGRSVFAAVHGRPPEGEEIDAISDAVEGGWAQYRDGVRLDGD